MKWIKREIWLIFVRELQDILKDKTIILLTVVLPIAIYPVILGGVNKLVGSQIEKIKTNKIAVAINDYENWLESYLLEKDDRIHLIKNIKNPMSELQQGNIQVWIVHDSPLSDNSPSIVYIYYFATNDRSREGFKTVRDVLEKSRLHYFEKGLQSRDINLNPDDLIRIEVVDTSTDREKSGYLAGKIIPILMILMILSGASFAAVDLIAGEKERGTLETLLISPVHRQSIIWGKFFVVLAISCTASIVNLLGIYLTLVYNIIDIPMLEEIEFSLGFSEMGLILLFTLPMAVLFSALLMIVSSFANSFKEGQYYLLPFIFFAVFPAVPALIPSVSLNSILAIIPITSLALAIKEVLSGTYNMLGLTIALVSNTLYAAVALRAATRILSRESILPGTEMEQDVKEKSYLIAVFSLFGFVFLLMYFIGSVVQKWNIIWGLWITQIVLISLPALLFIRIKRLDFKETLGLQGFSFRQLTGAFTIEFAAYGTAIFLGLVQGRFIPMPTHFWEQFSSQLLDTGYPFWVTLLTFSVSAGVCEELLFRGTLTGFMKDRAPQWLVILLVGFLFALLHMNVYRLLPTAILGFAYTYIRLSTGSIFPCMILHTLNNFVAIYLGEHYAPFLEATHEQLISVSGIMLILSFWFLGIILIRKKT